MSSGFLAWQVYILKHLQNLFVDRNHHIHDCHSHGPDHYYKNHGNSQRRSPALSHALVAFGLHLAFQSPTAQIAVFKTFLEQLPFLFFIQGNKRIRRLSTWRFASSLCSSLFQLDTSFKLLKTYFEEIIVDKKNKIILVYISELVFLDNVQYCCNCHVFQRF